MGRSAKVAVTLPQDIYRQVERLRRSTHASRSATVQRALVLLLQQEDKAKRIREYVEAYRQHPETEEEINASQSSAGALFAEVPWE